MATYNKTDKWPELWDISEKLANLADPEEDCLSVLCHSQRKEHGKHPTMVNLFTRLQSKSMERYNLPKQAYFRLKATQREITRFPPG